MEAAVVDAVLTASRTLVAVSTPSLGAAAEHTTTARYRMLVVLASRGSQRMTDLAAALDVAPSTAGRMTDRLVRKQLDRRHRARADRRSVMVSVTAAGRQVVDEATARRRVLVEDILAKLPTGQQQAIAAAFEAFTAAAGEIPEHLWPPAPAPGSAARGRSRFTLPARDWMRSSIASSAGLRAAWCRISRANRVRQTDEKSPRMLSWAPQLATEGEQVARDRVRTGTRSPGEPHPHDRKRQPDLRIHTERVTGIEPALSAWEAQRSPLPGALTSQVGRPQVAVTDPSLP